MKTYGVIMAGGGGSRLWPLSTPKRPKQFLNLSGNGIMINETIDRISDIVEKGEIFVVTGSEWAELTLSETGGRVKKDCILSEPAPRGTAACIGFAAVEIIRRYGDGVMCVLPSDHTIKDIGEFERVVKNAALLAESTDKLVTVGIKPQFAATGYGYIRLGKEITGVIDGKCHEAYGFAEKPDSNTAEQYLADGCYLWNSGMFFWKASVILKYFQKLMPETYDCLQNIAVKINNGDNDIADLYSLIPKISIDYGIMEKADGIMVVRGDFGWNDVGSFDALESLFQKDENGNATQGRQINIDTKDCVIYSGKRLVAALGVKDLVIVETKDAVLICHKDRVQDIRLIAEGAGNAAGQII